MSRNSMPADHFETALKINKDIASFPFYIKEIGFCSNRKFTHGNKNNYSDYLLLFTFSNMRFRKDGEKYILHPNDVVVSACNTPLIFSSTSIGISNSALQYIYVVIGGTHAQKFYNLIRKKDCTFHVNKLYNVLDHFVDLINIDYTAEAFDIQFHASAILHQLFLELYMMSKNISNAKNQTPVQDSAVNTALKFIHSHYQNDLSIDSICNSVSFSKYYFCKLFKEHTGMTIHQYVTEYRINKSKELLTYSKLPITAVANSVGFKNALTYTRSFERLEGMTPSQYRETY